MRYVDLSHEITDGLRTYPGLPSPHVHEHLSRADAERIYGPGVTFQIGMITMCSNTGTYLDTPFHRFADGHDLTGLPLERASDVRAVCVDCRGMRTIGPEVLDGLELAATAVLFRTDHSRHFGTDRYFDDHPHLHPRTADALVAAEVALAGIDSLNIDATHSPQGDGRPVHTTLLGAGVPIVEHLTNLDALPHSGFRFTAVPPKVRGMGTFAVRAHAIVVDA